MTYCYLGLGSNLGIPKRNLQKAVQQLRSIPRSSVTRVSSIYKSTPYGPKAQPNFCNMVVGISTKLSPHRLLIYCKKIEQNMGRVRKKRWGSRAIDIDVLIFGDVRLNDNNLTLPHAGLIHRDFALVPLLEIEPDITQPGLGKLSTYLLKCSRNII